MRQVSAVSAVTPLLRLWGMRPSRSCRSTGVPPRFPLRPEGHCGTLSRPVPVSRIIRPLWPALRYLAGAFMGSKQVPEAA
jgi:hypothetical protein